MAQKIFYDLLRPIPTYTEGPPKFSKNCNRPTMHDVHLQGSITVTFFHKEIQL